MSLPRTQPHDDDKCVWKNGAPRLKAKLDPIPKHGFRCPSCKMPQRRSFYALAHTDIDLIGPCKYCGKQIILPAHGGKPRVALRGEGNLD